MKPAKPEWKSLAYPFVLAMRNGSGEGEKKGVWSRSYDEAVKGGLDPYMYDTHVIELKDATSFFLDWDDDAMVRHYEGAAEYAESVGLDEEAANYRCLAAIWSSTSD